jgi:hypothetical protein
MEAVFEQANKSYASDLSHRFLRLATVFKRIFECWHLDMSLPFSRGNETYRTCISCGARRRFDLERWAMVGPYYYPEGQFALYDRSTIRALATGM